jgi:hypothetical protein
MGPDLINSARKHDLCRVLQACAKHGNDQQKAYICSGLKDHFPELINQKYSIHLAQKLYRLSDDKETLFQSVVDNSRRMIIQKEGSKFLLFLSTTPSHKSAILKHIFTPKLTPKSSHLKEIIAELPLQAKNILKTLGRLVDKLIDKGLVANHVVQQVICEYAMISDEATQKDISSRCLDNVGNLLETTHGVRLAVMALASADNKQRKTILKKVQSYVKFGAKDESYAYLFFIKLFEILDDTKRVNSLITKQIVQNITDFLTKKNGAKVILSLIPHRFNLSPDELAILDENLNTTSKKNPDQRRKEVLDYLLPFVFDMSAVKMKEMVVNTVARDIIIELASIISYGNYEHSEFVQALLRCFTDADIMNSPAHRKLKNIFTNESRAGLDKITREVLNHYITHRNLVPNLMKTRAIWLFNNFMETKEVAQEARLFFSQFKDCVTGNEKGEKVFIENISK